MARHPCRAAARRPAHPLCAPPVAARISSPADLAGEALLRSYRADEWPRWFAGAGLACPPLRGPVFDSSPTMAAAAAAGHGVALLPALLFAQDLAAERLVRPLSGEIHAGRYWLTRLQSRAETQAMADFRRWIVAAAEAAGMARNQ